MLLSNLLTILTLASASVLVNPFAARGSDKEAKQCDDWKCTKSEAQRDDYWWPMHCGKGWGDDNGVDYCQSTPIPSPNIFDF
jgi:hypothetical protein